VVQIKPDNCITMLRSLFQTRYYYDITNQGDKAFNIGQFVLIKSNLSSVIKTKLLITFHVHMKLRGQR